VSITQDDIGDAQGNHGNRGATLLGQGG